MSSALKPLADSPMFSELIMAIGDNWVLGIFTGLALTAILQSSSATTGILIAFSINWFYKYKYSSANIIWM